MSIYEHLLHTLHGEPTSLGDYRGTTLLVVNVASKCGSTPQYEGLERLQATYGDKGFTVIGFPCNQFGAQEPGSSEEIATFCSATYGVTFPMMEKIDVNGDDRNPVYDELTAFPDPDGEAGDIQWNFEKFLVSPDGAVIRALPPDGGPRGPRGRRRHRGQPPRLSPQGGRVTATHGLDRRRDRYTQTRGGSPVHTGPTNREPSVDHLVEVWTSVATACDRLGAGQWDLATDCPGWTVRDQLSHLIGVERMLLGDAPTAADGRPARPCAQRVRRAQRALGGGPAAVGRQRGAGRVHLGDRPAHPRAAHHASRRVRRRRRGAR